MECKKCGKQVDESFNLCPYCGETIEKQLTCNNCGAVIEKDFTLCPYCGFSVSQEFTSPKNEDEKETSASNPTLVRQKAIELHSNKLNNTIFKLAIEFVVGVFALLVFIDGFKSSNQLFAQSAFNVFAIFSIIGILVCPIATIVHIVSLVSTVKILNKLKSDIPHKDLPIEEWIDSGKSNSVLYIFMSIVIVASIFFPLTISSCSNASGIDSCSSVSAVKEEPDISLEQTLTGVNFTVYANDDYNQVEIEYVFYTSSGSIYLQGTLTGNNYKKGKSYVLTKSLSVSEMLNVNRCTYRIKSYN